MKDKGPCLVVMGRSDEYDGIATRDVERASRTDLTEESFDGISPDEEEDVVGEAGGIKLLQQ